MPCGNLPNINTSENGSSLGNTRQTLVKDLRWQVRKLEVDVVLLWPNTTTVANLHGHGPGDNVTRSKILGSRGVTLHESLTLGIEEVTALTTRTFGDQAASAVDTSGMELNELEILVGKSCTGDHGHTVTSTSVCRGTREVGTAVATSGEDSVVGVESVDGSVFLVVSNDTLADTVLHDQVSRKVLDEVVGVVSEGLAVKSVQKSVTSPVGSGTAPVCLTTLAELLTLTTKGTLVAVPMSASTTSVNAQMCIHFAILCSGEGASVVLELVYTGWRLAGHVVDRILVAKPV